MNTITFSSFSEYVNGGNNGPLNEKEDVQIDQATGRLGRAKFTAGKLRRAFCWSQGAKKACDANNAVRAALLNAVMNELKVPCFSALPLAVREAFKGHLAATANADWMLVDKDGNQPKDYDRIMTEGSEQQKREADFILGQARKGYQGAQEVKAKTNYYVRSGRPLSVRRIRAIVEAVNAYKATQSENENASGIKNDAVVVEGTGKNKPQKSELPESNPKVKVKKGKKKPIGKKGPPASQWRFKRPISLLEPNKYGYKPIVVEKKNIFAPDSDEYLFWCIYQCKCECDAKGETNEALDRLWHILAMVEDDDNANYWNIDLELLELDKECFASSIPERGRDYTLFNDFHYHTFFNKEYGSLVRPNKPAYKEVVKTLVLGMVRMALFDVITVADADVEGYDLTKYDEAYVNSHVKDLIKGLDKDRLRDTATRRAAKFLGEFSKANNLEKFSKEGYYSGDEKEWEKIAADFKSKMDLCCQKRWEIGRSRIERWQYILDHNIPWDEDPQDKELEKKEKAETGEVW